MKKLFSSLIVAASFTCGSVMAGDGPAPLNLAQLDSVSAGAYASVNGSTSVNWGRHSVNVNNHANGKARGNALEAVDANQFTAIEAAGLGKHVAWGAAGGTMSSAAAISYGHYYGYVPVVYH